MNWGGGRLESGSIHKDSWEADPKDCPCFNLLLEIKKSNLLGHLWPFWGDSRGSSNVIVS